VQRDRRNYPIQRWGGRARFPSATTDPVRAAGEAPLLRPPPSRSPLARAGTDVISRAAAMESRAAIDVPARWRGGHRRHHLGGVRLRCLGRGARRRCHLVPERRGHGSCCRRRDVSQRSASRQSQRSVRACRNRHQRAAPRPRTSTASAIDVRPGAASLARPRLVEELAPRVAFPCYYEEFTSSSMRRVSSRTSSKQVKKASATDRHAATGLLARTGSEGLGKDDWFDVFS
jgi:hypothetical protein